MSTVLLAEFIGQNRGEILDRWMAKATSTARPTPAKLSQGRGIPVFLDQLVDVLHHGFASAIEMQMSAVQHGCDLYAEGFTVQQLVHDYGGVCQAITDLAVETGVAISPDDFRTLNRCLDDAIADAVAEYASQEQAVNRADDIHLHNLVYMAVTSLDAIRKGEAEVTGVTGEVLQKSLRAISNLTRPPSK